MAPSVVCAITLLVLAMAAGPGIALKLEPTGTTSHIPPLLDCAPAPAAAPSSSGSGNLNAFRANVLSLLGALPAAASAAPTGFAAAHSGGAFARAFCFGVGARGGCSPSPGSCLDCLSAAAQDVAGGCHGHRGASWRAGCFLWYADTNASTAREEAWRGWFYDDDGSADDTPTAALGKECVPNTTAAAECSRCLDDSAKVVPALKEGRGKLSLVYGKAEAVVVVGYSCYLRVPVFPPQPRWETYVLGAIRVLDVVLVLIIEVGGILACIGIAQLNPA